MQKELNYLYNNNKKKNIIGASIDTFFFPEIFNQNTLMLVYSFLYIM